MRITKRLPNFPIFAVSKALFRLYHGNSRLDTVFDYPVTNSSPSHGSCPPWRVRMRLNASMSARS